MAESSNPFADYLTEAQVAEYLGISARTLRRWDTLRIGPPKLKLGPRRVRYKVDTVRRFIESGGVARGAQ